MNRVAAAIRWGFISLGVCLLLGCATTEDLTNLERSLTRRIQAVEDMSGDNAKTLNQYGPRLANVERFNSAQEVTNRQVTEVLRGIAVHSRQLKQMEEDLVRMRSDLNKSLGLTEDFFSTSEMLQAQMSQIRVQMDQSMIVLLNRLRMEREALDQAITQIEAGRK